MKNITRVRCLQPFTKLSIHHHGECYSCCPTWTKLGNVGGLTDQNSLMEVWNSEKMQAIRKAVLDDTMSVCDFNYCPMAIKNEYINLETIKNDDQNYNRIIDQVMAGKTIMDQPPYSVEIANSGKCNLKCIMCPSNDNFHDDDHLDEKIFTRIIPEILPGLSRLVLSGNGEVFLNPYSRKFLQSLNSDSFPWLKIIILTNGMLLTPELWKSISHNRYEYIGISIDGASKETYEKIRKNGKWDILRRNLDFISDLRRQNKFASFGINFCVMKSNYKEMKDFVELGRSLGCDTILFQKVFGQANMRENINMTRNKKIFVEIAQMLTDPIFNHPGVDTTLITEYRKYLGKRVFFWDLLLAKGREWYLSRFELTPMK